MTKNRSLKAKTRTRMSKTGEAYTPALRSIRGATPPVEVKGDTKAAAWVALTKKLGLFGNPYFAEVARWEPMDEKGELDELEYLPLCGLLIAPDTPLKITGCLQKSSRPTTSGERMNRPMFQVSFADPETGRILQDWIDLQGPYAKHFVFTWTEPTLMTGPNETRQEVQIAKKAGLIDNPWAADVAIPLIDLVIDGVHLPEGSFCPIRAINPLNQGDPEFPDDLYWMEIEPAGSTECVVVNFNTHHAYLHTFAFWAYSGLLAGPKVD